MPKRKSLETMNSVGNSRSMIRDDEDVLTINAGGKLITALRGTLTIPGESMWSNLFSGRWEESVTRDEDGRIFLDFHPELIEIIVNYLRMKKVEDPSDPLLYPHVPTQKENDFRRLLQYFGLTEFFTSMTFSQKFFVQSGDGNSVTMLEKEKNRIQLIYNNPEDFNIYGLSCTNELDPSGDGSFWKVQINTISSDDYYDLFLGITQNLNLQQTDLLVEETLYGWSHCGKWTRVRGEVSRNNRLGEESRYEKGECLYFRFKSRTLSMYSVRKGESFDIDDIGDSIIPSNPSLPTSKFYIHFIFGESGTAVTLGPMNAKERAVFENNEES